MQYLESTGRKIKCEYFLRTVIKNHYIQFKSSRDLKMNKEDPYGLPKLGKSTNVLGWLDRVDTTLRKLTGQDIRLLPIWYEDIRWYLSLWMI